MQGNAIEAIRSPGQHAGDGAGGVGVAAPVDHVDQTGFEVVGIEQGLEHRLHGFDNVRAGVLALTHGTESKFGMQPHQRMRMLVQQPQLVRTPHGILDHQGQ